MFSKQRFDFIFFIIFCFLSIRLQGQIVKNDASLKDWKLQTENLVNPIGIDAVNPRLRWIALNYTEQIGYQIQIATDSLFSELIFDSQRRQGDLN